MTKENAVKCKKCGQELPPGSAFCDNCGAPVGKRKKTSKEAINDRLRRETVIKVAAVFLFVIVITAVPIIIGARNEKDAVEEESFEDKFARMDSRITPEMYEKLEFGMNSDDVVDLFGEEGTEEYSRSYVWPGEYADQTRNSDDDFYYYYKDPRVRLQFSDNNNLIEIHEFNILDGKEIYEARAEGRVSRVTVNDEILASMKNRMSYREIADILGAEGVLVESESDRSGETEKTYEWEYVFEGNEEAYGRNLSIIFYNDKAHRNSWDEWGKE